MRCVLFCCAERAALSVICPDADLPACCPLSHLLRKCQLSQGESREAGANFWLLRTNQTCLSLWERCRAATERVGSFFEGAGLPPCGKTEGVLQIGKIRMRFALMQTCPRAAPSVTACAVPPSSGRKALVFRAVQTCLSLWERCRAATERAGTS